jgi:hypothetical protein
MRLEDDLGMSAERPTRSLAAEKKPMKTRLS